MFFYFFVFYFFLEKFKMHRLTHFQKLFLFFPVWEKIKNSIFADWRDFFQKLHKIKLFLGNKKIRYLCLTQSALSAENLNISVTELGVRGTQMNFRT